MAVDEGIRLTTVLPVWWMDSPVAVQALCLASVLTIRSHFEPPV